MLHECNAAAAFKWIFTDRISILYPSETSFSLCWHDNIREIWIFSQNIEQFINLRS